MGYTTTFEGQVAVVPPLSKEEIDFLNKFAATRRMNRTKGPYFVDGTGSHGQGQDADIRDHNAPPQGQPGLWCQWVPTEDGAAIEWDGGEKFYDSVEWMAYLIEHFIGSAPKAKAQLPFLQAHTLNGVIEAQGEESGDIWRLIVKDNEVRAKKARIVYD